MPAENPLMPDGLNQPLDEGPNDPDALVAQTPPPRPRPQRQEPRISGQAALEGMDWLEANDALPARQPRSAAQDAQAEVNKTWIGNLVSAIGRGAGQAAIETVDFASKGLLLSAKITGDEEFLDWYDTEWQEGVDKAEGILPEHEGGVFSVVEGLAQFGAGFVGAGKFLAPLKLASRARAIGAGARTARAVEAGVKGAAVDFTAFDPELDRLSNSIEDGPEWMTNPLTQFLAQREEDSELLSRSKAAMEGMLLGSTIDGILAGARVLRLRQLDKAGRLRAGELDTELRKIEIEQIEGGRPDRPASVVRDENGIRVELETGASKTFDTLGQAESHAAAVNYAHRIRSLPVEDITDASKTAFRNAAKAGGKSLDDMRAALGDAQVEYNVAAGWESFSKSITSVVESYKPLAALRKTDKRGIVQSHKETERLADDILKGATRADAESWARSLVGDTENLPETLLAIRKLQETQMGHISKLSSAVDLDPSNATNVNELRVALNSFLDVQDNLQRTSSGLGRSLESTKIRGSSEAAEGVSGGLQTAKKAPVDTGILEGMTQKEILNLARTFRLSTDATGNVDPNRVLSALSFSKEIQDKIDVPTFGVQKYRDLLVRFRTNMMLSGPRTQTLNFVSNLVTSFQVPAEYWWAGLRTGNAELAREGLDLMPKIADLGEALAAARRTWKLRQGVIDPRSKFDAASQSTRQGGDIGWFEQVWSTPGRAMMTADEFFKSMNSRARIRADAMRLGRADATRLGLEGDDYSRFLTSRTEEAIDGAFDNLSVEQLRALDLDEGTRLRGRLREGNAQAGRAIEHARRSTFQQDLQPGTLGHFIDNLVQEYPAMRLIVPFVRTPTNLFRFAQQRTPGLNKLQREYRQNVAAGGERAALAKAQNEVGYVLYSSAAVLAFSGMVTGRGPEDPRLAAQWRQSNQPYSIRLPGGGFISYERLQPLMTPLGLVADLVESIGETGDDDEIGDVVAGAALAFTRYATRQTWANDLGDFFDLIGDGDEATLNRAMQRFATSFTPTFFSQIDPDNTNREARTLLEALRRRTPGLSQELAPRRNILGEPILKPPFYAMRAMNPMTMMEPPESADIQRELLELGKAATFPSRHLVGGRIALDDARKWDNGTGQSPYDRMGELVNSRQLIRGMTLRQALERLVASPRWQRLTSGDEAFRGGSRFDAANEIINRYWKAAERRVMREYPLLQAEYKALNQQERASKRPLTRRSALEPLQQQDQPISIGAGLVPQGGEANVFEQLRNLGEG